MTMQVRRVISVGGNPNLMARSMTGTTVPRRLCTPRIHGGVPGHARDGAAFDDVGDLEDGDGVLLAGQEKRQVLIVRLHGVS